MNSAELILIRAALQDASALYSSTILALSLSRSEDDRARVPKWIERHEQVKHALSLVESGGTQPTPIENVTVSGSIERREGGRTLDLRRGPQVGERVRKLFANPDDLGASGTITDLSRNRRGLLVLWDGPTQARSWIDRTEVAFLMTNDNAPEADPA